MRSHLASIEIAGVLSEPFELPGEHAAEIRPVARVLGERVVSVAQVVVGRNEVGLRDPNRRLRAALPPGSVGLHVAIVKPSCRATATIGGCGAIADDGG